MWEEMGAISKDAMTYIFKSNLLLFSAPVQPPCFYVCFLMKQLGAKLLQTPLKHFC